MERKVIVESDPYVALAAGYQGADQIEKWDLRFLEMATLVSTFSKDPSTKCGAVIADYRRVVVGMGYNGFPRGCSDDAAIYENRPLKYERVIHAELNALLEAGHRAQGATLYSVPASNGPSCARCSAHIVQAGIRRVVFFFEPSTDITSRWGESIEIGLQMYREANVEVIGYQKKPVIVPDHYLATGGPGPKPRFGFKDGERD